MTSSIRNPVGTSTKTKSAGASVAIAAVAALMAAGCQSQHAASAHRTMPANQPAAQASAQHHGWGAARSAKYKSDHLMPAPEPDAATQRRDFATSVAMYENASVPAGPTYKIKQPSFGRTADDRSASRLLTEIPTFAVNSVVAPFWAVIVPPWTSVTYHDGSNFPPSYTVAPPQN